MYIYTYNIYIYIYTYIKYIHTYIYMTNEEIRKMGPRCTITPSWYQ